ncbi:hypothetical protein ES702_02585 [subsurface metagenome]
MGGGVRRKKGKLLDPNRSRYYELSRNQTMLETFRVESLGQYIKRNKRKIKEISKRA